MKINWIVIALVVGIVASGSVYIYKSRQHATAVLPFKTEFPQKRTIKQTVSTSGLLELKDIMKIGSFQLGFVKEIYVHENDRVKKGQLLALIDNSKNSSDVDAAKHNLDKAQKEADYQESFFKRQEALFNSGQLSKDAYQKTYNTYKKSLADVKAAEATFRKYTLEYDNTRIKAPEEGIVIGVYATKGMVVSDTSNAVLFEIAQDLSDMQATIDVDESDIGNIKAGQQVIMTLNSFPDLRLTSTINQVTFTPRTAQGQLAQTSGDQASYKARVDIDNTELLLRPGMVVNATIKVQKAENVMSMSGLGLYINPESIKKVAAKIGYSVTPMPKDQFQALVDKNPQKFIKTVWVARDKQFVELAISTGITDTMHWEIKDGLSATDAIVTDIQETEEMEELYKKWFQGSL